MLLLSAASLCLAQDPMFVPSSKAPPEVDKALRERVVKFYQLFMDGKFRQADQFVAEESKEEFFASEKVRYRNAAAPTIEYSPDFTKAIVVTIVETEWRMARLGNIIVHPPVKSYWKIVNGEWMWYIVKEKSVATPWGTAQVPDNIDELRSTPRPDFKKVSVGEVLGGVNVDKQDVRLSSFEKSSDAVIIKNSMPGEVNLEYGQLSVPGLKVKLDKSLLKAGESAKLEFKYEPPDASPKSTIMEQLRVKQLGNVILLRITFAVPGEKPPAAPEMNAVKPGRAH